MIAVRLATVADRPHIVRLLTEMDLHYQPTLPAHRPELIEALLATIDTDRSYGTCFALAFDGNRPVGIACFALLHPGHQLGGVLFLKDLFVCAADRGGGAGTELMRLLAVHAGDKGCARIDFTAESADAIRLYERLGAAIQPQKVFLRIEGEQLRDLAASRPPGPRA